MQTYLPKAVFGESAEILDNCRLEKQITDVVVLLCTLEDGTGPFKNHPCATQWRGYELALIKYGVTCYKEWQLRFPGKYHVNGEELMYRKASNKGKKVTLPPWLGNEQYHSSHRSALLKKSPEYYAKFGWADDPETPLYWPVK